MQQAEAVMRQSLHIVHKLSYLQAFPSLFWLSIYSNAAMSPTTVFKRVSKVVMQTRDTFSEMVVNLTGNHLHYLAFNTLITGMDETKSIRIHNWLDMVVEHKLLSIEYKDNLLKFYSCFPFWTRINPSQRRQLKKKKKTTGNFDFLKEKIKDHIISLSDRIHTTLLTNEMERERLREKVAIFSS